MYVWYTNSLSVPYNPSVYVDEEYDDVVEVGETSILTISISNADEESNTSDFEMTTGQVITLRKFD